MIAAAWLALALAVSEVSNPAPLPTAAPAPASNPAPPMQKSRQPLAMLYVTDDGCVSRGAQEDRAEWRGDEFAIYHLHVMLSSSERIREGSVDIDISPGKVVAYVPVEVTESEPGEPVPTCIRPVTLRLTVEPLPRGNYDWQFRRGTRAQAAARAEASGAAGAAPEPETAVPKD